jgi:hypothetical protein
LYSCSSSHEALASIRVELISGRLIGQYKQLMLANLMTRLLKLANQMTRLLVLTNHPSSAAEGGVAACILYVFIPTRIGSDSQK